MKLTQRALAVMPSLGQSTPAQARSRLAPYLLAISDARSSGYSYKQIAEALQKDSGVKVDAAEVRRYLMRHQVGSEVAAPPREIAAAPSAPVQAAKSEATTPPAVAVVGEIISPAKKRKAADDFADSFSPKTVKPLF